MACPAGKRLIGGGARLNGGGAAVAVQQSFPDNDNIFRAQRARGRRHERGVVVDGVRGLRRRELGGILAGRASALPASTLIGVAKAPPYSTTGVDALRLPGGEHERDLVAVEEPLEIRIGGEPVAVTMRTPGHDEELALGFCVTEGLEPVSARAAGRSRGERGRGRGAGFDPERLRRHFYTSSSCGVCGKGAIEAVQVERAACREPARGRARRRRSAPGAPPRGAACLRRDWWSARDRALRPQRRPRLRARGRRPAQRDGQGRRLGVLSRAFSRWRRTCSA